MAQNDGHWREHGTQREKENGIVDASLKQSFLIPSGCQIWNRQVVIASPSGRLVGYASTLGVCIYDISTKPPTLSRVFSQKSKENIVCIAWSPVQETLIISVSESELILWSLTDANECRCSVRLPSSIASVSWCIHEPNIITCSCLNGKIYEWNLSSSKFTECFKRTEVVSRSYPLSDVAGSPNVATTLAWHSQQPHLLCGYLDGSWVLWDHHNRSLVHNKPQYTKSKNVRILSLSWEKLGGAYALIAYNNGCVVLWDVLGQVELKVFDLSVTGVQWVEWLEFSPGGFVTFSDRNSLATIWNVSQEQPLDQVNVAVNGMTDLYHDISSQEKVQIHSITPISGGQGKRSTLMLLSLLDGSVAVWSWKNRSVLWKSEAGHTETIFDCCFNPTKPDVLASSSYDGSVMIWHCPTRSITYSLLSNEKRDLPKSWNSHDGAPSSGFGAILYSVCWSPDGKEVAASSYSGSVFVFNVESQEMVLCLKNLHSGPCFKVDWFRGEGSAHGLLASSGGDGKVNIFDRTGDIKSSLSYGHGCFRCHWSPFTVRDYAFLAVGCKSGEVLVFSVNVSNNGGGGGGGGSVNAKLVFILRGHQRQVFDVVWSPLVSGLLATGSDDCTVRVWTVPLSVVGAPKLSTEVLTQTQFLQGHTSKVRPLAWSHEIPQLLSTGSWDASINTWDISTGELLCSSKLHFADVYGLASHPDRPFEYVSSSRDNTLRFWRFDCKALSIARLKSLLQKKLPMEILGLRPLENELFQRQLNNQSTEERTPLSPYPLLLVGSASKELTQQSRDSQNQSFPLELWKKNLSFWNGIDQEELWFLMSALTRTGGMAEPKLRRFVQTDRVLELKHSQALLLESYRNGLTSKAHRKDSGVSGLKKRDALRMASEIHLKCGRVHDACRVLVEIEHWEEALVLAPMVSLEYWRELLSQYAHVPRDVRLAASRNTLSIFSHGDVYLHLASGNVSHVINLLVHRMQLMDALVVACAHAEHRFEQSAQQEAKSGEGGTRAIEAVSYLLARYQLGAARSIPAACILVGNGSPQGAVEALVRGNNIETAYAVCSCFSTEQWALVMKKTLLFALSIRAQGLGDRVLSLDLMKQAEEVVNDDQNNLIIIDVQLHAVMLLGSDCSDDERDKLLTFSNIRQSERELVQDALEAEQKTDLVTAVRKYLLAMRHREAVELLMKPDGLLQQLVKEWHTWKQLELWSAPAPFLLRTVACLVRHVNLTLISDPVQKRKFVGWACWVGGWLSESFSHSLVPGISLNTITASLYHQAQTLCIDGPSRYSLMLAEAAALLRSSSKKDSYLIDAEYIIDKVDELDITKANSDIVSGSKKWVHQHMKQQADAAEEIPLSSHQLDTDVESVSSMKANIYGPCTPVGSPPPSNFQSAKSVIGGSSIQGTCFLLEDNKSFIAGGDAVMWAWVNPFSPLGTGERLFPF